MKKSLSLFLLVALMAAAGATAQTTTTNGPLDAICDVSDIGIIRLGQRITYEAIATGGTGSYTYEWRGTENLSGSGRTNSIQYKEGGGKGASVIVTSGNQQVTAQCGSIQVAEPPLRGACEAQVSIVPDRSKITWSVDVKGGVGDYEYDWNIPANDDDKRVVQEFSDSLDMIGTHSVRIEVTSGDPDDDREIDISCSVTITSLNDLESSKRLSCNAPSTFVTGKELVWRVQPSDLGDMTITWSGSENIVPDPNDVTNKKALVTYTTPGVKTAKATIDSDELTGSISCGAVIANADDPGISPTNGEGCFIATAAYGSYLEKDVYLLREFRDEKLRGNILGEAFIQTYYIVSPSIADTIRESDSLRESARTLLQPLIEAAR